MTRVPATKQQVLSDLVQIDKTLLRLARLFGEAAAANPDVVSEADEVRIDDPQNEPTKHST